LQDRLAFSVVFAEWVKEKLQRRSNQLSFVKIVGIRFDKWAYAYLSLIPIPSGCHQLPERSFFYRSVQFPVCARCTGIAIGQLFGGLLMASLLLLYIEINPIGPIFFGALVFTIPMGIDWSLQYFFQVFSTNSRRLISGLLCGFGLGGFYSSFLIYVYQFLSQLSF